MTADIHLNLANNLKDECKVGNVGTERPQLVHGEWLHQQGEAAKAGEHLHFMLHRVLI